VAFSGVSRRFGFAQQQLGVSRGSVPDIRYHSRIEYCFTSSSGRVAPAHLGYRISTARDTVGREVKTNIPGWRTHEVVGIIVVAYFAGRAPIIWSNIVASKVKQSLAHVIVFSQVTARSLGWPGSSRSKALFRHYVIVGLYRSRSPAFDNISRKYRSRMRRGRFREVASLCYIWLLEQSH
jgi:hypothetical protein